MGPIPGAHEHGIPAGLIERKELRIVIAFTNSGRGRSTLSQVCVEPLIVRRTASDKNPDPPAVPQYNNRIALSHIFDGNQTIPMKWGDGTFNVLRFTDEELSEINGNAAWLWIYGTFVYTDFIGQTYDAGFAFHWEAVAGSTIGTPGLPNPRGFVREGP